MTKLFRDRTEAGELLADALKHYAGRDDVIVLGLPRGGVPVAFVVARRLKVPLDVFVVRKLGVPDYRELAMGAIATGGVCVINEQVVQQLGISQLTIDAVAADEQEELGRRELAYRGHTGAPILRHKTAILVDDGIATGSTMRAAIQAVRLQHPARVVVAAPTAAPGAFNRLRREADETVILMVPEDFSAVGQFYENFAQTTDEEVTSLLAKARRTPMVAETTGS